MSDGREELAGSVRAALEAARLVLDPACRGALLRPLLAASQLIEAQPAPATRDLAASLSEAAQVSLIGLVRGLLALEMVELAAGALNACFAYATPASRIAATATRSAGAQLLVAARAVPALRHLEGPTPDDSAEGADMELLDDDEDDDDAGDDDESNDDPGAAVESLVERDDAPPVSAPALVPDVQFPLAPPPPVRFNEAIGAPVSVRRFHGAIIEEGADALAMLARHRAERPMRERADAEARMLALADAIVATGPSCIAHLRALWRRALKSPDPWRGWAPAFVLGALDGLAGLQAIADEIARMGPRDHVRGRTIAEALAVSPHPAIGALAEDLTVSPHPVARAIGVQVLAGRGVLSPDMLRWHLVDANVPVLLAAIRAGVTMRPAPEWFVGYVLQWMHHPDGEVAWEAARAASLLGRAEPWVEVHEGGPLAGILGARASELFILFGKGADVSKLDRLLERHPLSRAVLSCVARFGHPGSWAFLVHCLGDDDLAVDALEALITLFGPRVEGRDAQKGPAWRDAIAAARFDGALRYRCGVPWAPHVVGAEIAGGGLNRHEAELRLDELAVRLSLPCSVDLAAWASERNAELTGFLAAAEHKGRDVDPGSWHH